MYPRHQLFAQHQISQNKLLNFQESIDNEIVEEIRIVFATRSTPFQVVPTILHEHPILFERAILSDTQT